MPPTDLGQLLLEESLISARALGDARRGAAAGGQPLAEYLVAQRLLSDETLTRTLRRRLGLPVVDLTQVPVDNEAVRLLAQELAERWRALPLAVYDRGPRRVLRVAVADPLDEDTLDRLGQATGCVIEPVLAAPSALRPAIERCYRDLITRVIPRRRSGSVGVIGGGAVPVASDEPATVRLSAVSAAPAPADPPERSPAPKFLQVPTRPMHSVPAEADVAARLDALVALLVRRGVLHEEEYAEEVRRLLRLRAGEDA